MKWINWNDYSLVEEEKHNKTIVCYKYIYVAGTFVKEKVCILAIDSIINNPFAVASVSNNVKRKVNK
jgi:hypothetical protein